MPVHSNAHASTTARVGFNSELHEFNARWQLLGHGYRAYSPGLMRFQRPDNLSPFDQGGLNAYAYCGGDPVNRIDPSGRYLVPVTAMVVSAAVAVTAGVAAGSVRNGQLREGLAALAAVAGLIAAASMVGVGGRGGAGRLPRSVQTARYDVSRVPTAVQRHPGGSYLKARPGRAGDSSVSTLKDSFNRWQRGVTRKALGKPRFRYRKAPPPDIERIRKMAPVERRALLASGYRALGDKPDSVLYLNTLGRFDPESFA